MDFTSIFRHFILLLTTYLATVTSILLLIGTFEILNNENILTDETDKRKSFEKKYHEL